MYYSCINRIKTLTECTARQNLGLSDAVCSVVLFSLSFSSLGTGESSVSSKIHHMRLEFSASYEVGKLLYQRTEGGCSVCVDGLNFNKKVRNELDKPIGL